jgi:transposase-like protein
MPRSEVTVVSQRTRFVADAERGVFSFAELCRRYGISQPTGYLWVARYAEDGPRGLYDHSHRPQACPDATPDAVWEVIRVVRKRHPTWGPKKLLWAAPRRDEDAAVARVPRSLPPQERSATGGGSPRPAS